MQFHKYTKVLLGLRTPEVNLHFLCWLHGLGLELMSSWTDSQCDNSVWIEIGLELRGLSCNAWSSRVLNRFKNGSTTDCFRLRVRGGLFCGMSSTLFGRSSQNLFLNHSQRFLGSGMDKVSRVDSSSVSLIQLSEISSCGEEIPSTWDILKIKLSQN